MKGMHFITLDPFSGKPHPSTINTRTVLVKQDPKWDMAHKIYSHLEGLKASETSPVVNKVKQLIRLWA